MAYTERRVLTVEQMAAADQASIAAGTPGTVLMERAGRAVAAAALARRGRGRVLVLAGPGNNGGDGFVAARLLAQAGWTVNLALLGDRAKLGGDAAAMAARWHGPIIGLDEAAFDGWDVIIDALFGAGLARPLEGPALAAIQRLQTARAFKIAVDLPSGVAGNDGRVLGGAAAADVTVTFAAKKPGHLLLPGRDLCGQLRLADIGVDADLLPAPVTLWENHPELWRDGLPDVASASHKYSRGHLLVAGGGAWASGAARLAALAGLRAGAGLVTVLAPEAACASYAAHLTTVMLAPCDDADTLRKVARERRAAGFVLGPGNGVSEATRAKVLAALATGKPVVLDADGLSVFEGQAQALFAAINGPVVLTPHEGEFRRLFPDLAADPDKVKRAGEAARRAGAVVLLKGADTVIAAPDGRTAINANAPAWLATAGSGDVLAGIIGALLAGGMAAWPAAAAAAWIHGAAAQVAGPGLIADDLIAAIQAVRASKLSA
ncbi:MAG: bifunctional ADP-dependent NAD(P)H-hydrate dehydratase/NAD(P)H-hydrate epimerase [Sphingomonadales bacterium]